MNFPRLLPAVAVAGLLSLPAAADPGTDFFEKKIRPVLVEHCYACHSAEAAETKKLQGRPAASTRRDGLLEGGDSGPAVVPGKPAESLLLKALRYDGDMKMPPEGQAARRGHRRLRGAGSRWAPRTRATAAAVARQVGHRASRTGRKFWAYQPPRRPAAARGEGRRLAAGRHRPLRPRRRWRRRASTPAADADRATLARRLYFDLIGLPPTPEEVDAFVNDTSPDAYERLVDRLLASPAVRRALGPALARRRPLRRVAHAPRLRPQGGLALPRLRHRRLQRRHAVRPLRPRADRRRPAARGDARRPHAGSWSRPRSWRWATPTSRSRTRSSSAWTWSTSSSTRSARRSWPRRSAAPAATTTSSTRSRRADYYALAGILRNAKTLEHANVSKWLERAAARRRPSEEAALKQHEAAVAALRGADQGARKAKPSGTATAARRRARRRATLPGIVVDDAQAKKVGDWKESQYSGSYIGDGYIHDDERGQGREDAHLPARASRRRQVRGLAGLLARRRTGRRRCP